MAVTDSTDDERRARVLARAAEILARADAAIAGPRPDRAESDRAWAEWEAGRQERARRLAWEADLERGRAPKPAPAPAPKPAAPAPFLKVEVFETVMIEVIKCERALWREQVAALQIRLDALTKGLRDDEQ